jgi:hypothetical protein
MAYRKPMPVVSDRHALAAYIWSKIDKGPDCWPWIGAVAGGGYGHIVLNRGRYKVTRLLWWLETGVWPGVLGVLHTCDNPVCCRPDHLFLGTQADNAADMMAKGRNPPNPNAAAVAAWKARTHCKWGHEFTPENIYNEHGHRKCRKCGNARHSAYYFRKKAERRGHG